LDGKKYTCIEGLLHLFLFLNNANTKLPLGFEKKNKATCRGVFIVLIWFCCKYQVRLRVIKYFYVYKLLFILKKGWHGPANGCRPRPLSGTCCAKTAPNTAFRGWRSMHLATPSIVARRVCRGSSQRSSGQGFFLSPHRKTVLPIAKKQESLAICLLS